MSNTNSDPPLERSTETITTNTGMSTADHISTTEMPNTDPVLPIDTPTETPNTTTTEIANTDSATQQDSPTETSTTPTEAPTAPTETPNITNPLQLDTPPESSLSKLLKDFSISLKPPRMYPLKVHFLTNPSRFPEREPKHIFPFLLLPAELRTAIYRHCPTFTLLQLTHTHPQLRSEINAHPDLIAASFGYFHVVPTSHPHCRRTALILARRSRWAEEGREDTNLNIMHITALSDRYERIAFLKVYRFWRPGVQMCFGCSRVVPVERKTGSVYKGPAFEDGKCTGSGYVGETGAKRHCWFGGPDDYRYW
ncbi:hypothetical protein BJ508DRAFT_329311 [Ascobolus immersus RN42]|uniref:F-box domain-containing protein n=1 Tax=Ascobolus immersus RN42 TaxID=1160509 RepID=A0A3N4HXF4_ASCIM|nr:hypothetical protein BJ508DRAFT_329311 [Ascobolus immersus RN42]